MTALQVVLSAIGGVLICAVWLVLKPVTIMDQPPPASRTAADKHEILYVRGKAATRGNQGARKQKAFLDRTPGELVFVEEDANRWLASTYGTQERTIPIQGIGVSVGPRVPSVRLVGDELELGLEVAMDREGGSRVIVAQARGRFIAQGGRQVFVPRQIYLGSCPLPWNLGGRQLYQQLASLYPVPENVATAWNAVGHAAVADSRIHLVVGAAAVPAASEPASAPALLTPVDPAPAPALPVPVPAASEAPVATPPLEVAPTP